jgi:hypothetical protein
MYQGRFDPSWRGESLGFRLDDAQRGDSGVVTWLEEKIRLEEEIYGRLDEGKRRWWPTRDVRSLSQGLDSERAAANIVQVLFVVIFAILVVGIAT